MNLYILRHGIAADRSSKYPDDNLRPLTRKGIDRMRREAKGMSAIGIAPDVIISSPLVRAIQTAEIVQQWLERAIPSGEFRGTRALGASVADTSGTFGGLCVRWKRDGRRS